jgi:pSer/pThr/pTyr-binding forkhead associated (FHA) protein
VEPAALILPDGRELTLEGDVSVGRDQVNQVRLASKTVSRRHALVVTREGKWWVADTGSFNGTFLNDHRVPPGVALQLRHADRIRLGSEVLVFSAPIQLSDADRTEPHEQVATMQGPTLSPFQLQVVHALCADWLDGGTLDELPSNEEIAAKLGTPGASATVKAALRRAYAKAGLTSGTPHAKRRALCRVARQRGWI